MSDSALRLDRVSHRFGDVEVMRSLTLEIPHGEFLAVVGPSGCGKTTLLNILSGFTPPSDGRVEREGVCRTVFQSDGLFPWMTALQNIALGLGPKAEATANADQLGDLLELIGLSGFGDRYPHQLSGGMRQRVELARALAGASDVLLLDEPFSSLDYLTRLKMRGELARILAERPRTTVLVTHDIEEAAELADRVVVLSERPATIRGEHRIVAPRPRSLTDPEVVGAVGAILAELGLTPEPARSLEETQTP